MFRRLSLALLIAFVGNTTKTIAATFTLQASVDTARYYDPVTDSPIPYTPTPSGPVIMAINLSFQIGELPSGQIFGQGLMDITLTGGLEIAPYAINGPSFTHDTYADDATPQYKSSVHGSVRSVYAGGYDYDAGPDPNDLKALLFTIAQPPYLGVSASNTRPDPRLTLGQNGPAMIGQAWIEWDGQTPGTLAFSYAQFSTVDPTTGVYTTQTSPQPQVLVIGAPEPVSFSVFGLGSVVLLNRRRKA